MIQVQRSTELSAIAREEGTRQIVIADNGDSNKCIYIYDDERLAVWVSEISVTVEQHSLWQRWLP